MASNIQTAISGWSTTAGSNQPDSTDLASTLREDLQAIQAAVRYLRTAGTIASASTTDMATKSEEILSVSGTTTITALGTVSAGMIKVLVFEGALTFTHNGTSLILPTAANITTAAGDAAVMLSLGSGNWRCLNYMKASGYAPTNHWVLIDSDTFSSSSSIDLTGISLATYRSHRLVLTNLVIGADAGIQIQFGNGSIDTGANYRRTVTVNENGTIAGVDDTGETAIGLTGIVEATNNAFTCEVTIMPCSGFARTYVTCTCSFVNSSGNHQQNITSAYYNGAVDRVRVSPTTSTITSGTVALFGIK